MELVWNCHHLIDGKATPKQQITPETFHHNKQVLSLYFGQHLLSIVISLCYD